jgi:3-phenylpropionate/trans-cinnamate dioxygenase ferredoxin component
MSSYIRVATAPDIPDGTVRVVVVEGKRIALCRAEGAFFAVEDLCTHDNGPLGEGTLEGCEIECPRHGARFDVRTGAVTCLPAVRPIRTFAVRVQGNDVEIDLSEQRPRSV